MRKYSQKDYCDAVSELVDAVTKRHRNNVKSIYAGGSFARGDFVPGRSDVDIYIVVDKAEEELQKKLKSEAIEIEKKYFEKLRSVLDEVLGISITTLKEIQDGRSFLAAGFEYSNFIKEGKLLWGEDIKALIPEPELKRKKETAQNYLNRLYEMVSNQERNFKWLRWIPFKFLPKKNKERWTRQAFCLIFRTAAVFLGSKGVYVSKKEDIVSAFKRCTKEEPLDIISFTLSLWEKWKTEPLKDKETKQLLENSMKFVKQLRLLQ